jgi:hypothetical protein
MSAAFGVGGIIPGRDGFRDGRGFNRSSEILSEFAQGQCAVAERLAHRRQSQSAGGTDLAVRAETVASDRRGTAWMFITRLTKHLQNLGRGDRRGKEPRHNGHRRFHSHWK